MANRPRGAARTDYGLLQRPRAFLHQYNRCRSQESRPYCEIPDWDADGYDHEDSFRGGDHYHNEEHHTVVDHDPDEEGCLEGDYHPSKETSEAPDAIQDTREATEDEGEVDSTDYAEGKLKDEAKDIP